MTLVPAPRRISCGHGSMVSFLVVVVNVVLVAVVVLVVGGRQVIATVATLLPCRSAPLMDTNNDSPETSTVFTFAALATALSLLKGPGVCTLEEANK